MKLFNLQSDPHLKKQKNEMKINQKNLVIVQKSSKLSGYPNCHGQRVGFHTMRYMVNLLLRTRKKLWVANGIP